MCWEFWASISSCFFDWGRTECQLPEKHTVKQPARNILGILEMITVLLSLNVFRNRGRIFQIVKMHRIVRHKTQAHTHTHTHTHFWEYNHRIPQHFSLNSRDRFTLLVNFTHEYSLRKCAMTILNTEWFYGVCEVQWNFHKAGYVSLLLLNSCHFIFTDRFF